MGGMRTAYKVFVGKPEDKRHERRRGILLCLQIEYEVMD
jgi:hypothetical protein